MTRPPPRSTLFPYTTLFRSSRSLQSAPDELHGATAPGIGPIGFSYDTSMRNRLRSEEHTSELQSQFHLVCRLLLEKKKSYAGPLGFIMLRPLTHSVDAWRCG